MNKIFANSEEKYLKSGVLYFKAADSILYHKLSGSTYSDPVSADELANMFMKGLLVIDTGSAKVRPTEFAYHTGLDSKIDYSYVQYTTVGASDKAVATKFYSNGYSAS